MNASKLQNLQTPSYIYETSHIDKAGHVIDIVTVLMAH